MVEGLPEFTFAWHDNGVRLMPPGSDPDAVEARVRAYRARMQRELLGGPSFPVFGARAGAPWLGPGALAGWHGRDDGLTSVALLYGDPFALGGPAVLVRTSTDRDSAPTDLDALIEEEQRRIVEHTGSLDAVLPTVRRHTSERSLDVEGVEFVVEVRHEGNVWAAALRPQGLVGVTTGVVGRGVAVEDVQLCRIADLSAAISAGERLLDDVVARQSALAPAVPRSRTAELGFQAHLCVVEVALAHATGGDRPWVPRDWGEVWEAAAAAQMRLGGESREEADRLLTVLVNHGVALAERTTWFANPGLRRAAVSELVRWTMFGSQVAALPAIEAWDGLWQRPGDQQKWLACWDRWVEDQFSVRIPPDPMPA